MQTLPLFLAPALLLLQYYDFPVVSMRSAVWRNMAAGVEGFRVSTASGNGGCWEGFL